MNRTSVSSTNIRSVGYDPFTHVLEVEFRSGSIYQYARVPGFTYSGLMRAYSKGSYHNEYIKDRYTCVRVR
ncbi:KTSC domain-containing protein [Sorangium sp. So ce1389]|uniref:KTSC domain-containing protein n=1 Tax=Sorangium sp. So ce1389 TaxID=3133336 RepID=UPI003F617E1C